MEDTPLQQGPVPVWDSRDLSSGYSSVGITQPELHSPPSVRPKEQPGELLPPSTRELECFLQCCLDKCGHVACYFSTAWRGKAADQDMWAGTVCPNWYMYREREIGHNRTQRGVMKFSWVNSAR